PQVLKAALRRPEVAKLRMINPQRAPVAWLAKALKIQADAKYGVLRVQLAEGRPREQAVLVNAVGEEDLREATRNFRPPFHARIVHAEKEIHANLSPSDSYRREKARLAPALAQNPNLQGAYDGAKSAMESYKAQAALIRGSLDRQFKELEAGPRFILEQV